MTVRQITTVEEFRKANHTTMSKQVLNSEKVRHVLKDILLGPAQLYEALRE